MYQALIDPKPPN